MCGGGGGGWLPDSGTQKPGYQKKLSFSKLQFLSEKKSTLNNLVRGGLGGPEGGASIGQVWTHHLAPAAPASRPSLPTQFHDCACHSDSGGGGGGLGHGTPSVPKKRLQFRPGQPLKVRREAVDHRGVLRAAEQLRVMGKAAQAPVRA